MSRFRDYERRSTQSARNASTMMGRDGILTPWLSLRTMTMTIPKTSPALSVGERDR